MFSVVGFVSELSFEFVGGFWTKVDFPLRIKPARRHRALVYFVCSPSSRGAPDGSALRRLTGSNLGLNAHARQLCAAFKSALLIGLNAP